MDLISFITNFLHMLLSMIILDKGLLLIQLIKSREDARKNLFSIETLKSKAPHFIGAIVVYIFCIRSVGESDRSVFILIANLMLIYVIKHKDHLRVMKLYMICVLDMIIVCSGYILSLSFYSLNICQVLMIIDLILIILNALLDNDSMDYMILSTPAKLLVYMALIAYDLTL